MIVCLSVTSDSDGDDGPAGSGSAIGDIEIDANYSEETTHEWLNKEWEYWLHHVKHQSTDDQFIDFLLKKYPAIKRVNTVIHHTFDS